MGRGRAGGLALGATLLVLGGSNEPLRADNFDFNLVGPDWLSVLAFTALALFQGALTVAIAARLSRGVPSIRPRPRVLLLGRISSRCRSSPRTSPTSSAARATRRRRSAAPRRQVGR